MHCHRCSGVTPSCNGTLDSCTAWRSGNCASMTHADAFAKACMCRWKCPALAGPLDQTNTGSQCGLHNVASTPEVQTWQLGYHGQSVTVETQSSQLNIIAQPGITTQNQASTAACCSVMWYTHHSPGATNQCMLCIHTSYHSPEQLETVLFTHIPDADAAVQALPKRKRAVRM